jgi:hypothetical protein
MQTNVSMACSLVSLFSVATFNLFLILWGFLGEWVGLCLNSGVHACKASDLPLEPHLQSIILFWLFWR